MQPFLILDGDCPASLLRGKTVWRWSGDGPGKELAQVVAERLLPLRAELNAWTVDTARMQIQGRSVEERLKAGSPLSMWWCATLTEKHPKITHGLFEVLMARVVEQLMDEQNVRELELVTTNSRLAAVFRRFCGNTGRKFAHILPLHAPARPCLFSRAGLRRLYGWLPAPLQALVRFPAWLWQQKRHLPHTTAPRPDAPVQSTLVTYFPNIDLQRAKEGRFRSRYWENLHDLLTEKGPAPVNWLLLFFPSAQCTLKQALALRDSFAANGTDGLSFHFYEEFLDRAAVFQAVRRALRLFRASRCIEAQVRERFKFQGSQLNFWLLLKNNWKDSFQGWRCLDRCLSEEAFKAYARWAGAQDFTVYVQENCPWERMLCQAMHDAADTHGSHAAHKARLPQVYGMQHSTVRPTDFRYFEDPRLFTNPALAASLPDQYLNNGTAAQQALLAAGMPADRSTLVEALRYQYLAAPNDAASPAPDRPRLLICTSFFADETDAHLRTFAAAYTAGLLYEYDIAIKPHPYLPVDRRLAELLPNLPVPPVLVGAIADLLTPGTTVWASNSTTVALEAVYRNLPVIVQAASNDLNLSPIQDLPVPFVRTVQDVAAALAALQPPALPPDYLCLDPDLPRWRRLLRM